MEPRDAPCVRRDVGGPPPPRAPVVVLPAPVVAERVVGRIVGARRAAELPQTRPAPEPRGVAAVEQARQVLLLVGDADPVVDAVAARRQPRDQVLVQSVRRARAGEVVERRPVLLPLQVDRDHVERAAGQHVLEKPAVPERLRAARDVVVPVAGGREEQRRLLRQLSHAQARGARGAESEKAPGVAEEAPPREPALLVEPLREPLEVPRPQGEEVGSHVDVVHEGHEEEHETRVALCRAPVPSLHPVRRGRPSGAGGAGTSPESKEMPWCRVRGPPGGWGQEGPWEVHPNPCEHGGVALWVACASRRRASARARDLPFDPTPRRLPPLSPSAVPPGSVGLLVRPRMGTPGA